MKFGIKNIHELSKAFWMVGIIFVSLFVIKFTQKTGIIKFKKDDERFYGNNKKCSGAASACAFWDHKTRTIAIRLNLSCRNHPDFDKIITKIRLANHELIHSILCIGYFGCWSGVCDSLDKGFLREFLGVLGICCDHSMCTELKMGLVENV